MLESIIFSNSSGPMDERDLIAITLPIIADDFRRIRLLMEFCDLDEDLFPFYPMLHVEYS